MEKNIIIFDKIMRVSYNGNTPAFQAGDVGSIPSIRSNKRLYYSTFEVQLVSGIDINGYCNVSFISSSKKL